MGGPDDQPELSGLMKGFVLERSALTADAERERSWYFEEVRSEGTRVSQGYIHYGSYGFESKIKDGITKKTKFHRKRSDVEEIPLYYQIWFPEGSEFGLIALQSFSGRSCVSLVLEAFKEYFREKSPSLFVKFERMLPEQHSDMYKSALVKSLVFRVADAPGDLADAYLKGPQEKKLSLEVRIQSGRRKSLGSLSALIDNFKKTKPRVPGAGGLMANEVFAEVYIGSRRRKVGMFGVNADLGLIDITEHVEFGGNGHPTFASLAGEVTEVMRSFEERPVELVTGEDEDRYSFDPA